MNPRIAFFALVAAVACVPATAKAIASAELYSTNAYYYGRFDARIYFAAGDGVVSAFFLWKEGSEEANAYWNELDVEKFGADCAMQTNAYYGNPETQHQQKHSMSVNICGGYHDYRIEWTPTYIAWAVDGKEIRRDTGATATAYADNASAGMTFHFNIWPGNSSFGGNINNTKLPVHQYISWVQYSSYDNGNFKVEWREEFDSAELPSGWAAGDWSSPFNLSTHNVNNVAFVNGIAVMSLTDDNATGNPGTPPVDPNASVGTGGSPGTGGATGTGGGSGGTTSGAGGTTGTGGTTSTTSSGGTTGSGGTTATGDRTSTGGASGLGGTSSTPSSGGATTSGGTSGSGGTTTAGGRGGAGGTTSSGGASGSDGGSRAGGTTGAGGTTATGGSSATGVGGTTTAGGSTATGGNTTSSTGGTVGPTATDGGCSCSTAPLANPPWLLLMALSVAVLLLRRKEI